MEFPSNNPLGRMGQPWPVGQYFQPAQHLGVPVLPLARDREPPPFTRRLLSGDVHLKIRQEPHEALQAQAGKEKMRKPVDPPPIVELTVTPEADPGQHYLQSPYLFMNITLYKAHTDEPVDPNGSNVLIGTLASSLHRLKDVNNRGKELSHYSGFFIFADISVKIVGEFRLLYSLFDLRIEDGQAVFLGSVTSKAFRVLPAKEFKSMSESTYLSRAFSDQGVRIRLRKEPRGGGAGTKRSYQTYNDDQQQPRMPSVPQDSNESNKRAPFQGSPSGAFASPRDSFPTPYNPPATLPYPSQQTNPGYQPRNIDQQTPQLRPYASMDSITQSFPRPADASLSTLQDSGQSMTGPDLGFRRRPASTAQSQPTPNIFRSLAQGHDNFTFSASPSMPSMPTSTSIPQYAPNSHWGVTEGQQQPMAPPIPHSLSRQKTPLSASQTLPTIGLPLPLPQSTGPSHQPHDSVLMGPAQFNHSDALGQSGSLYPDNPQLPLAEPYPMARYDGQQQMSTGEGSLYPNMNALGQGTVEGWHQSTG